MKIEIDDFPRYARTNDGIKRIAKYVDYENRYSLWFENESCGLLFDDKDLPKMSDKIIDLIEAGDYVNGMEVMEADWYNENDEYEEGLAFPMYSSDDLQVIENWLPLRSVNIESIVTKEQFKKIEFRLEK